MNIFFYIYKHLELYIKIKLCLSFKSKWIDSPDFMQGVFEYMYFMYIDINDINISEHTMYICCDSICNYYTRL